MSCAAAADMSSKMEDRSSADDKSEDEDFMSTTLLVSEYSLTVLSTEN